MLLLAGTLNTVSGPPEIYISGPCGGPGAGFGGPGGFQVSSKSSGKPLLRLLRREPPKPPPGPPKPLPGRI